MHSLGDNVKVHFVYNGGPEGIALDLASVQYRLYSCYDYIKSKKANESMKVNSESFTNIMKDMSEKKHIIQDSGLFTFLFGSDANVTMDYDAITNWQTKLTRFVLENKITASIVECDAQRLIGVEKTWELREKLRHDLPHNKIINVFHLQDDKESLNKLIDFSDYIAISVPELRIHKKGTYREDTHTLAKYIKSRKPSIDIHLLGCTEAKMLRDNDFCTSSDSSSWLGFVRYGTLQNRHMRDLNSDAKKQVMAELEAYKIENGTRDMKDSLNNWIIANTISARHHLYRYINDAGPQD